MARVQSTNATVAGDLDLDPAVRGGSHCFGRYLERARTRRRGSLREGGSTTRLTLSSVAGSRQMGAAARRRGTSGMRSAGLSAMIRSNITLAAVAESGIGTPHRASAPRRPNTLSRTCGAGAWSRELQQSALYLTSRSRPIARSTRAPALPMPRHNQSGARRRSARRSHSGAAASSAWHESAPGATRGRRGCPRRGRPLLQPDLGSPAGPIGSASSGREGQDDGHHSQDRPCPLGPSNLSLCHRGRKTRRATSVIIQTRTGEGGEQRRRPRSAAWRPRRPV